MSAPINSYNYLDIYSDLNIDIKKLYCCMLGVSFTQESQDALKEFFKDFTPYYSEDKKWVKGLVYLNHPHLTLLYGLLDCVKPEHVKRVLEGLIIGSVVIDEISYFDSPDSEEYYCVIAKVGLNKFIKEAHQRLSLLPHINTFLEYNPHITLGYIKKDNTFLDKLKDLRGYKSVLATEIVFDNNSGEPTIIKKF